MAILHWMMEQVLLAHSPIKHTFQLFPTLGYRGLNADVSMHAQCLLKLAALILLCNSVILALPGHLHSTLEVSAAL